MPRKPTIVQRCLAAGVLALLSCQSLHANFILGPHRTVLCGVPVGRKVAADRFGASLVITNQTASPQTYTVEVRKPADIKRELMFGYEGLPETKFVAAEREVVVGANSSKAIRLTADIPAGESYYNRKWEAEVVVREKTSGFGIELQGQLWIETEAKPALDDSKAIAGEGFILAPATLELKALKKNAQVRLYNLSKQTLTFLIVSASPPEAVKEEFIPYSKGYERLSDQEWVTPSVDGEEQIKRIKQGREIAPQKRIRIEPGAYKTIRVDVNVPDKASASRKESFLFVRCPELNTSQFVRIRIDAP